MSRFFMVQCVYFMKSYGFEKTAAVLEFSFRFLFWPIHRDRHVILHRPTKFRPNRIKPSGVMTTCRFLPRCIERRAV